MEVEENSISKSGKEDFISKILNIDSTSGLVSAVRPLKSAFWSLNGFENSLMKIIKHPDTMRRFWEFGFGNFFHLNRNILLPVSDSEPEIKIKSKSLKIDGIKVKRSQIETFSENCEISSLFLSETDNSNWWTLKNDLGNYENRLITEIGSYLQQKSIQKKNFKTLEVENSKLIFNFKIPETFPDQEVLNTILPDLTLTPRGQVMDHLPLTRSILRLDLANQGSKSRAGRILGHLQCQGIHLRSSLVQNQIKLFL